MFRLLITLVFCVFFMVKNSAQSNVLSLKESINKAIEHSYSLKRFSTQQLAAANELSKTRAARNPRLTLDADVRFNPLLPTNIIPGEAFASPGQPAGEDKEIQFGTLLNAGLGLNAAYTLWDPAYALNMDVRKAELAIEQVKLNAEQEEITAAVAEAYYVVALRQEQLELAKERLRRAEDLLSVTRTRAEAGSSLDIDVRKSELEVQNATASLEQARIQLERSRFELAKWMGITPNELTGTVTLPEARGIELPTDFDSTWLAPRPRVQIEAQQIYISNLQQQIENRRYLPRIDLYANLSAQHQSNDLAIWQRWFPFAYAGVKTSVTLFDGHQRKLNEEKYRLQALAGLHNLSQIKEDISFDIRAAALDRRNALSQLNNAQQALDNAKAVATIEQVRYREGRLPYSEWRNTEFSLREAEANVINSRQNFLIADLRWCKASGQWR